MVEYSNEELKGMARTLINAKKDNDFRYLEFVMTVAIKTGTTPVLVDQKIIEYANA